MNTTVRSTRRSIPGDVKLVDELLADLDGGGILSIPVPTRTLYVVKAEMKPGKWTILYSGHNRSKAIEKSDFWDERVNVQYIVHEPPRNALEVAHWRFDYLHRQLQEQRDAYYKHLYRFKILSTELVLVEK